MYAILNALVEKQSRHIILSTRYNPPKEGSLHPQNWTKWFLKKRGSDSEADRTTRNILDAPVSKEVRSVWEIKEASPLRKTL